jgi:hypothetical protein
MNLARMKVHVVQAGQIGGVGGEFAALQEAMTALAIRAALHGTVDFPEVYEWYAERLLALHEKAEASMNRIPYRLERNEVVPRVVVARIRAAIETLPEEMLVRPPIKAVG